VRDGHWWGTITSEPGSGGDVLRTRATARPSDPVPGQEEIPGPHYRLTGEKHFGSGSGIASFMLTTVLPEGELEADWFFLDVRENRQTGTSGGTTGHATGHATGGTTSAPATPRGMTLTAPWDGHGMTATQSHGMRFADFPAVRLAAPGLLTTIPARSGAVIGCWFTAVTAGIVSAALEAARGALSPRLGGVTE
jgi:alkylation response protein AidB-like acyl-CoA dehydrogenase